MGLAKKELYIVETPVISPATVSRSATVCRCSLAVPGEASPVRKPWRPDCTPKVSHVTCGSKWLRYWFESLLFFSYRLFVLSVFVWKSGKGRRKHKVMCCYIVRKPK
jgi:hypothetical protein